MFWVDFLFSSRDTAATAFGFWDLALEATVGLHIYYARFDVGPCHAFAIRFTGIMAKYRLGFIQSYGADI